MILQTVKSNANLTPICWLKFFWINFDRGSICQQNIVANDPALETTVPTPGGQPVNTPAGSENSAIISKN